MSKPILFFDFDGVVVHSLDMWLEISLKDHPWATRETWVEMARGNVHDEFEKTSAEMHEAPKKLATHHGEKETYIKEQFLKQRLAKGMEQAIPDLAKAYDLYIVTSGQSSVVQAYLESQNLAQHFLGIYGADIDRCKEKKVHMILAKTGCAAHQCLFISDTLGDLREATRAGVPGIGVSWGLHDKVDLQKGEPIAIIDTVEELAAVIHGHFS